MFLTIEGEYKDGEVALAETPTGVKQAKVLVTFLTREVGESPRHRMAYGQFAGKRLSTEEDFRLAEWRGDMEEHDGD